MAFELDGNIYCNVTGCQEQKYNFNGSTTYTKQHDITWNISFTITNKDVYFYFKTERAQNPMKRLLRF